MPVPRVKLSGCALLQKCTSLFSLSCQSDVLWPHNPLVLLYDCVCNLWDLLIPWGTERVNSQLGSRPGAFTLLLLMSQLIRFYCIFILSSWAANTITNHWVYFFLISSTVNTGFLVIRCWQANMDKKTVCIKKQYFLLSIVFISFFQYRRITTSANSTLRLQGKNP